MQGYSGEPTRGRSFSAVLAASHIIFSCITFVFLHVALFKEQQIQPECTVRHFLNLLGLIGFVVEYSAQETEAE